MYTITVQGTNLFALAAAELGDATQWINIARTNNLSDPFITELSQITIPDYSAIFEDGIGPE
jgi:hypothetical protein